MRENIGNLEGLATLYADGNTVGPVQFDIDIWTDYSRGIKSASGSMRATREHAIRALRARHSMLRLSSGDEIEIVVTKIAEGVAGIEVSGPVPGY